MTKFTSFADAFISELSFTIAHETMYHYYMTVHVIHSLFTIAM